MKKEKQKIYIRAFGPIKEVILNISDLIILNGKQSSGKSTIAKVIYLFKSLPNVLSQEIVSQEYFYRDFEKNLVTIVRKQILSIFGTTKHFDDFYIRFNYCNDQNDKYIKITKEKKSGHARVIFSDTLKENLRKILDNLKSYWQEVKKQKKSSDFLTFYTSRMKFFEIIKKEICKLFNEDRETLFIPAGRSLVSTLSGELRDIESYNFDYLMKDFVQRIVALRDIFSKELKDIIEDKKKLSSDPIDFSILKIAIDLYHSIVQGEYKFENGEERIFLDKKNYVKIKFASSGQQESLWILNLLFINILERKITFTVFEEPEAHLYPLTQYDIVKFIALSLNSNNKNQGIITTHSPYIMSAINTLLMAGNIGKKNKENKEKINTIINEKQWLDINKTAAYFVDNGKIIDMIDKETNIIELKYIDEASHSINFDFDKLLEIDEI